MRSRCGEAAKRRPDDVSAWLGARTHRASGVTMRDIASRLGTSVKAVYNAKHRVLKLIRDVRDELESVPPASALGA